MTIFFVLTTVDVYICSYRKLVILKVDSGADAHIYLSRCSGYLTHRFFLFFTLEEFSFGPQSVNVAGTSMRGEPRRGMSKCLE
jgi:hypothetical protein